MNKNYFKLLAALTIASAVLTGCNNEPARTGNDPSTITTRPEEQHYVIAEQARKTPNSTLKSEDGVIYKTLTIEEIQITQKARIDKPAADKMEEVLSKAADRHFTAFDAGSENIFSISPELLPVETKVDYTTLRNDGRAISIREDVAGFNAGTQVSAAAFIYNFDPTTGAQITTDIFYKAGDEASFDEADTKMHQKLVAKYGEDNIKYENLSDASYPDAAQDTWYFTEDGIKVFFSAGEIADASLGVLEIEYTKDELGDFTHKYFN